MPSRLKRCEKCNQFTISEDKCHICGGSIISVYPPKFSMEEKYQQYRIPYFEEKMKKEYGISTTSEK